LHKKRKLKSGLTKFWELKKVGSGYGALGPDYEGPDIAEMFNQMGVSAFMLKYRLPNDTIMDDNGATKCQSSC